MDVKRAIVRLDDVGAQSSARILSLVARSLSTMTPLCIGLRGVDLERLPAELVLLLKHAVQVGTLEIWNHGYRGLHHQEGSGSAFLEDAMRGHECVVKVLGDAPSGYMFLEELDAGHAALLQKQCPGQAIFEMDFQQYTCVSLDVPELDAARKSLEGLAAVSELLLHARVSRWSAVEFIQLEKCIEQAGDFGYLPVSTFQARAFDIRPNGSASREIDQLVSIKDQLATYWKENKTEFTAKLPNFESYYLKRFLSDTEKNYLQVSRILFPRTPRRILDLGCGLGNWSLGFIFSGASEQVILNDVDATIAEALRKGIHRIGAAPRSVVSDEDLLSRAAHPGIQVDFMVCANTYNYVEPVVFFQLARSCIEVGGLLLLMVQTSAFNKMRFRVACRTRNRSVGAEVLRSELGMLLRRTGVLFPAGVRHVFDRAEITALARLFDFIPRSTFVPLGEDRVDGQPVYECYIFQRSSDSSQVNDRCISESIKVMPNSFGSRANQVSGVSSAPTSLYPSFEDSWSLPQTPRNMVLSGIKEALARLQQGSLVSYVPPCPVDHHGIDELVNKLNRFIQVLRTPA